ncbi:NHLM bacteriocin system ABC transporter, peptidase/ATP-binding protein/NHLM bacteriocin system ABC transporter, ATP-binding protein [Beggiatoa alba B18LD]|uniref:NHLM bacteriocin system ABC transporter, peptidase/ATP-binding protein/NHLM bacteriocin system ABC transporter, ATP-binding protein n=1 Tax=Beggiatoa alba B18LD TaxID=395493 RepID=I3CI87_9GAMM|nr:NHLP family bacteriocin export ABC transporter peptidase/permease/ATPase subunit [Beggiatoa alba]EIJ43330.1 NHLM bacteriocin system ABC transporter, peptidase/ATP-binding protein/NHLM bacteriocin system ABC transporter, ATP-binding protein [Beggiatoa alba B18LD]
MPIFQSLLAFFSKTPRPVRTATYLQMESAECGAVALAIIFDYYGLHIPLETLRIECGVGRDGSKASHLVQVARRYGMNAKGYTREPAQLANMQLPLIVFWQFNHFVVVEGFGKDKVYLNDPATGRRTVTMQAFDTHFTGIVLEFSPSADFVTRGDKQSILTVLNKRLHGEWRNVLFLLLTGFLFAVPNLIMPVLTQIYIDNYWLARQTDWLILLLFGMSITTLMRTTLEWIQTQVLNRFYAQLTLSWSGRFLWHVLRLPIQFYSQRSAGEICQRVAINSRLASLLAGDTAESVLALIMAGSYAIFMLFFDTQLASVALAVALLNFLILQAISQQRQEMSQQLLMAQGKLMGASMNGLRAIESLKASGSENDFFIKWAGLHAKALNYQQQFAVKTLFLNALPTLLNTFSTLAILALGSLSIIQGTLTLGALIAFQSLAMGFMNAVNRLINVGVKVQVIAGDMQRLEDVMNQTVDAIITDEAGKTNALKTNKPLSGELRLAQVSFRFCPLDPPLLKKINFEIHAGQQVALVGMSGSGKSTLAKLIVGLYTPSEGNILFDGKARAQIPRTVFNHSLAFVDQDVSIFEGTIRENLILWNEEISDAEMIQATQDACIHEVIISHGRGYDEPLLENGGNFSGGELQRLEIARALMLNPTILILDEATRMLDIELENKIYANLRRRGCSCLILTHRLTTLENCDEILVLEAGEIVQRGTHSQLQSTTGAYQRLIAEQLTETRQVTNVRAGNLDLILNDNTQQNEITEETEQAGNGVAFADVWASCQHLEKYTGIRFIQPPPAKQTSAYYPIAEIALASQLRYREVTLTDTWWQADCGHLLAFDRADNRPLLLIPTRRGNAYTQHDVLQQRVQKITATQAQQLKPRAILFYPPLPDKPLNLLHLMRFSTAGHYREFIWVLLLSVFTTSLALLMPWSLGLLISTVIPSADIRQLSLLMTVLATSAIIALLLNLQQSFLLLRLGTYIEVKTQSAIWDRVLKLPADFFRHYTAGDLAMRVNSISAIRHILSGTILNLLFNGLFSCLTVWLMLTYSVKLTVLAISLAFIAMIINLIGGMRALHYERDLAEIAGKLSGLLLQLLNGIIKLRTTGAESRAFSIWASVFIQQQERGLQVAYLHNVTHVMTSLFSMLGSLAIFTSISVYGWENTLSTSQFLVFITAFGMFSASMLSLSSLVLGLLQIVPLYERAKPILQNVLATHQPSATEEFTGEITINNLSFTYDTTQPPILNNFSLHIHAGEFIAIVGNSGSGKSTLLRLLMGFEQAMAGEIYYDGQALANLDLTTVRRQMGVVLQNGQLLEGDIFSNIVGSRSLTLADAWQAVRISALAEDIEAMPMGMHTILGDRATTLSGGQRQRLLIARAIVHQPRIILLDEAMSALDNQTQAQVMQGLRQLKATKIMITHQLNSLAYVDRVVHLCPRKTLKTRKKS